METLSKLDTEKYISFLMKTKNNNRCFDCNNPQPSWISLNYGVFVCTKCAALHRSANQRPKSILLDNFTLEDLLRVKHGGNFAHNQSDFKKRYENMESVPEKITQKVLKDEKKEIIDKMDYKFEKIGDEKNETFGKKICNKEFIENKKKNVGEIKKPEGPIKKETIKKQEENAVIADKDMSIERNTYAIKKNFDIKRLGFGFNKIKKKE